MEEAQNPISVLMNWLKNQLETAAKKIGLCDIVCICRKNPCICRTVLYNCALLSSGKSIPTRNSYRMRRLCNHPLYELLIIKKYSIFFLHFL